MCDGRRAGAADHTHNRCGRRCRRRHPAAVPAAARAVRGKDNNASASLGPFIRLFDGDFTIETVKNADIALSVTGEDGSELTGVSNLSQISRSPESLVAASIGRHHQYPEGLVLYTGTMFAPVKDRGGVGKGFTHKMGDKVSISTPSAVKRTACTVVPGRVTTPRVRPRPSTSACKRSA